MSDLIEELEKHHAAMTPGPYHVDNRFVMRRTNLGDAIVLGLVRDVANAPNDAAGFAALHNSLPAILADLKSVEGLEKDREQLIGFCLDLIEDNAEGCDDLKWLADRAAERQASNVALRAERDDLKRRLKMMHFHCTPNNCILGGGQEHSEFFTEFFDNALAHTKGD